MLYGSTTQLRSGGHTKWWIGTAVNVPNLPLIRPTISWTWLVSFWSVREQILILTQASPAVKWFWENNKKVQLFELEKESWTQILSVSMQMK